MCLSLFTVPGDGASAPDCLSHLSSAFESQALSLVASGHTPDDISGALTTVAVRLLIASDGRAATAAHLHDLAAKLEASAHG